MSERTYYLGPPELVETLDSVRHKLQLIQPRIKTRRTLELLDRILDGEPCPRCKGKGQLDVSYGIDGPVGTVGCRDCASTGRVGALREAAQELSPYCESCGAETHGGKNANTCCG